MSELRHINLVVVKHVLRYLHGTVGYGLRNISDGGVMLYGYTNSDWEGSVVDRKSIFAYCFSLGLAMISCSSHK